MDLSITTMMILCSHSGFYFFSRLCSPQGNSFGEEERGEINENVKR